jgi:hypothetical protein
MIDLDNAEWIRWQWVEMFLTTCAQEIRQAMNQGRRLNNGLVTDLGEWAGKKERRNLSELPNTTFTDVISWLSNGMDFILDPTQLETSYTAVRRRESLVDFINKNGSPKDSYLLILIFKRTLEQSQLDKQYIGLHANRQIINDPIYGPILHLCCV